MRRKVCSVVEKMAKTIHSKQQETLQELLRIIRREANLNQQELAEALGKPQSFVSKYESGERLLDVLELRQICLALNVSLSLFAQRFEELL